MLSTDVADISKVLINSVLSYVAGVCDLHSIFSQSKFDIDNSPMCNMSAQKIMGRI